MIRLQAFSTLLLFVLLLSLASRASAQDEPTTLLSVSRSLGFRIATSITPVSDYTFEITSNRRWTYQSYDGVRSESYSYEGELTIPIESLAERLAAMGIDDIPEPDPNAPRIADIPTMYIRRVKDGQPWSREIRPRDDAAIELHNLIQSLVMGVREIPGSQLQLLDDHARGIDEPISIENEADWIAAFGDASGTDNLSDIVDFERELLLVFRWAGSGQDDLCAYLQDQADRDSLTLSYRIGETEDLRQHVRYFVIPKSTDWELVKLRPR